MLKTLFPMVAFLFCSIPFHSPLAETGAHDESMTPPLTLGAFLKEFASWDPALKAAAMREATAQAIKNRALNPQRTDLYARPAADFAYVDPANESYAGQLQMGRAGVTEMTNDGRRYDAAVTTTAILPAQEGGLGGDVALDLSMSIPYGRNKDGALYRLEGDFRRFDAESVTAAAQSLRSVRCWGAIDLYVHAWYLQAQAEAYDEFVVTIQKRRDATARAVRRRLMHTLERLTADSALVQLKGDQAHMKQRAAQLMATLNTYRLKAGAEVTWSLADPADDLEKLMGSQAQSLDNYPILVTLRQRAAARKAEARFVEARYETTVELVPNLGAGRVSGLAANPQNDLRAGVVLNVLWPMEVGQRSYELAALQNQAREAEEELAEQRRQLVAQLADARVSLENIKTRKALNTELQKSVEGQIDEAWRRFDDGRIKFQDAVQHYDDYRQARLDSIELERLDVLARVQLSKVMRPVPRVCR